MLATQRQECQQQNTCQTDRCLNETDPLSALWAGVYCPFIHSDVTPLSQQNAKQALCDTPSDILCRVARLNQLESFENRIKIERTLMNTIEEKKINDILIFLIF